MKRWSAVAAFLCLTAVVAAQTDLWTEWRFSAPIEAGAASEARLLRVQLPNEVTAHAQPGWRDLRVVDEAGHETPYVLHFQPEVQTTEWREARLLEVSFLPGESTQGIVDLGENPPEHNSLTLGIDLSDYSLWVEVAVSNNARTWRILNERSPIYRFTSNGLVGNQTVRYSTSRSRYLRIRLLDGTRKLPFSSARIAQEVRREAEYAPLTATFRPDPAAPRQQTWWTADLGATHPVSQARFELDAPDFSRALRISRSGDGQHWIPACSGDIFRIRRGPTTSGKGGEPGTRERLRVSFPEVQGRYWRVEVLDRNDPPLQGLRISLFTVPRFVVFRAEPGHSYRLMYGNSRAGEPSYSLAQLVQPEELESAPLVAMGTPVEAVIPERPLPWSERNPAVLWGALIAAAAVLGLLALRALRG